MAADEPLCLLLLSRPLESFILHDQAVDLLRAEGVVAVEPPRVRYGALARLPGPLADRVAHSQARRLRRALKAKGKPRVVVIFHPLQYPLAVGLLDADPDAELWYSLWDRYTEAYDATPTVRDRIADLHAAALARSAYTFAVSDELARLARADGHEAHVVPSAADAFPAAAPANPEHPPVVAVSLGHLGIRNDWALLRAVSEAMPELTLLLVGEWHDDELAGDEDYAACREASNLVWLGRQTDAAAAQLIRTADVGIVPFSQTPFNDAGLPNRILKYARQGRRTIAPPLAGTRTWENAVTFADGPHEFVAALRAAAGARQHPDEALRAWAAEQTARHQNDPLWQRLHALDVDTRVTH
jgi:hypothetical protein